MLWRSRWLVCRGRPAFYRTCPVAAASGGWNGLWRPEHADVHYGSQSRGGPVQLKQDLAAERRWGGGSLRVGRQSPILNCHEHHPTENSRHRRHVATFRDRSRIPRTTQAARILGRGEVGSGIASCPPLRPREVREGGFEEDAAAGLKPALGKQQEQLSNHDHAAVRHQASLSARLRRSRASLSDGALCRIG